MPRNEPPKSATWLLEHCTPAGRDQALAGDLLEEWRTGRSDAWYWRQAGMACAQGWLSYLDARRLLLVFAVIWSMMAPSWTTILDRVENHTRAVQQNWQMDWPFSSLPTLVIWLSLNLLFFWVGILVFLLCHPQFKLRERWKDLRRALGIAALAFMPIYFFTFAALNLFAFNDSLVDRHSMTLLGSITDVHIWALALRLPYLLTLLCALWRVAPQLTPARAAAALIGAGAGGGSVEMFSNISNESSFSTRKFFALVVAAGAINTMLAGFLLFDLPSSSSPTLGQVLGRAIMYVFLGVLVGTAGAWMYWNNPGSPFRTNPPVPFSLFALVCAAGWMWLPAMLLFAGQVSGMAALMAMAAAYLLSRGARETFSFLFEQEPESVPDRNLFADTLYRPRGEPHGYVIALAIYAAGYALITRSNYSAAALLAVSAAMFTAGGRVLPLQAAVSLYRSAALRLAKWVLPVILVTAWALLDGVSHRNRAAALAAGGPGAPAVIKKQAGYGVGGYVSLILLTAPEKQQILAPVARRSFAFGTGDPRPLVIPFNGQYWFMQPPDMQPSRNAHRAIASPLNVDIHSENGQALRMEAHQWLPNGIPLSRCRELQLDVTNADQRHGSIWAEVLVSDSAAPRDQRLSLGEQTLVTSEPGSRTAAGQARETLRFAVPGRTGRHSFNELTVRIFSDHHLLAPNVGIREFRIIPR